MKNKLTALALLTLALCCLSFAQKPQTWEYKQTCKFHEANALGAEGWELAGVSSGSVSCFYFKRPK